MLAGAEGVLPETRDLELFGQPQDERLHTQGHLLAKDRHRIGQGRRGRLPEGCHLGGHRGVGAGEFPALQIGEVREDVVGIHAGLADGDVRGEDQRDLFRIAEDFNELVAGRQGVGGRRHIKEQGFDLIWVHIPHAGDDFLINIAGKGVPNPFGREALKQRGFIILNAMADDGNPPGLELLVLLGGIKRLALFIAHDIVGRGLGQPAHPVVVADEDIQEHISEDVIKAGGMLGDTPMDIGHGPFAVVGELPGQLPDIAFAHPGQIGPIGQGLLHGRLFIDLQHTLHRNAVDDGVHQQVAGHRVLLVVGVKGHGFAVFIDDESVKLPVAVPLLLGPLLRRDTQIRTPKERIRHTIFHLYQPGSLGPGGLVHRLGRSLVGVGQVAGIIALVFDDPADHAPAHGSHTVGPHRQPFPSPGRGLGAAGVHHRDLDAALDDPLGDLSGPPGRTIVGLIGAGAHEEDEFGVAQVSLPIKFAAVGELAFHKLVAHGLAGEIERTLAHGGVAVGIDGAQTGAEKALQQLGPPGFQAAPVETDLVVLQAQIGVVGIDEILQIVGMLGLKFLQGHLLGRHLGCVFGQGRRDLGITTGPEVFEALHLAFAEQIAAVDDFLDGLLKGNDLPLVFAPFASSFQDFDNTIRVVQGLDPGLALGTDGPFDGRRLLDGGIVADIGGQGPGAVGVAVNLGHHPVHQLHLDAAVGIALLADGKNLVLRPVVHVVIADMEALPILRGHGRRHLGQTGGGCQRPSQKGGALEKFPPVHPLVEQLHHTL